ncbi:MAG: hypothetical protein M1423_07080 [Acidobacteria bacterium]|nr:hypothetical protein [Acidobacteriota bacterium]
MPVLTFSCDMQVGTKLALWTSVAKGRMKMQTSSAIAVDTRSEPETAEFTMHCGSSSPEDLLARLDRANETIRTLEKRVAMQERTYMNAMQEKNRKIRELQSQLQGN